MKNYRAALKSYFTTVYNGKFEKKFSLIKVGNSRRKHEKEILSGAEYERLRKVLPTKFKLLFDIKRGSGLRISELLDLKINDIIFKKKKGRTKIVVQKGKGYQEGDKPENAVLREEVVEKVQNWIEDKKLV